MDPSYVRIFDTTLRDGEQSPGASMTAAEKLEVARALSRLGVDVIEAGFPAASPDDLAAVRAIAAEVGVRPVEGRPSADPPTVCALARAAKGDLDKAWEAVSGAKRPRIHTFLATSDLHLKHKLRLGRDEVKERVGAMVAYARNLCDDVEFSPEDAGRSDPQFLYEVLEIAIRAGASTLNIPDTVGFRTPEEFGALIAGIREHVRGVDKAILSVHCHDDLGLATANTLAGLRAGARQAEVTINGIGERAGNSSLEEVVMALKTREPVFGLRTGIDTTQLLRASRLVSSCTGIVVPPNKAVVGANAFAHESGIHQDGMLKHEGTYEIMNPQAVGAGRTRLVLGKHSGRHALKSRLEELGVPLDGEALDRAFERFKALADRKKEVSDADLEALAASELREPASAFALDEVRIRCGTGERPTALLRLRGPDGNVHAAEAMGTGPVDAAYKAVDCIVRLGSTLLEYRVHAVTAGIDALGQVSVRIQPAEDKAVRALNPQRDEQARTFHGHGADTDIIVASVKAYLAALNGLYAASART